MRGISGYQRNPFRELPPPLIFSNAFPTALTPANVDLHLPIPHWRVAAAPGPGLGPWGRGGRGEGGVGSISRFTGIREGVGLYGGLAA